jgi:hypothetical protein
VRDPKYSAASASISGYLASVSRYPWAATDTRARRWHSQNQQRKPTLAERHAPSEHDARSSYCLRALQRDKPYATADQQAANSRFVAALDRATGAG